MLRRALTLLLAFIALPVATSQAAVTTKKAIWGPAEIDSESQFPVYKELGAGIYQTTLDWSEVADLEPLEAKDVDDPSYLWPEEIETAVREAKSEKMQVALTITGKPRWAKKASDLGTFAKVAAKRFKNVHLWIVDPGKSSARKYAASLDSAYAGLKSASKRNKVIGGGSTNKNVASWVNKLKLSNGKRPRMDMYAHDPSGSKAPTASSLKKLEKRVAKVKKGLKLYLSPVHLTLSPSKQAAWIKAALKATKKDSKVYTFSYQGLVDDSDVPASYKGLLGPDGSETAAFTAFKNG
jgi:hypothetical protein